ncbi:hypothetical protein FJK98_24580 [Micromonospora sp. HM134]|uniref:hypothetical protein n=1 Tax=Micromonospora sp. HM134 TaxID=2583243 RepID=UPI0011986DB0|nr:hypothetical protein [Micromonospora sp. HM134]QDY09936.1 hypothetical protein FJK98_24580 [Micromonospora sp. HM134]
MALIGLAVVLRPRLGRLVRRMLLTQPALTMLGDAADLFRPSPARRHVGLLELLGEAVGRRPGPPAPRGSRR